MIPLFEYHPELAIKLPYVSLGEFPTSVQKLDQLGKHIGLNNLFIKRDDLSGKAFGGNKIRKLEFILGKALRSKVNEVLTFGSAGSNHALATAIYAKKLGLSSISMLLPQPNAYYVRRNLLLSYSCQAELHLLTNTCPIIPNATPLVVFQLIRHRLKKGKIPHGYSYGWIISPWCGRFR
jgi:1-aminocyclopropane-1-carboxylate deaminase/D-cysteine desulfhydrase-like pyridoxal-dependent ACC family enzyme